MLSQPLSVTFGGIQRLAAWTPLSPPWHPVGGQLSHSPQSDAAVRCLALGVSSAAAALELSRSKTSRRGATGSSPPCEARSTA